MQSTEINVDWGRNKVWVLCVCAQISAMTEIYQFWTETSKVGRKCMLSYLFYTRKKGVTILLAYLVNKTFEFLFIVSLGKKIAMNYSFTPPSLVYVSCKKEAIFLHSWMPWKFASSGREYLYLQSCSSNLPYFSSTTSQWEQVPGKRLSSVCGVVCVCAWVHAEEKFQLVLWPCMLSILQNKLLDCMAQVCLQPYAAKVYFFSFNFYRFH